MKEIEQPEDWTFCKSKDHWVNLILERRCWECERELATAEIRTLPNDAEIDGMAAQNGVHECQLDEWMSGKCDDPSHDYELVESPSCYACLKQGEPCADHMPQSRSEAYRTAH
jgi:hypothetical protein